MRQPHALILILGVVLAGGCTPAASQRTEAPRPPGAATPFTTYEAELGATDGEVVRAVAAPAADAVSPALEASSRAFVELARPGAHLDIVSTTAANALVIRHCIPDAASGGGTDATLSLYVNGSFRQKLALTSRHAWLYGPGNGQSDDPAAGRPHVFWDEARAFITGGVAAGDALRLQQDDGDDAAFYRIDLVDLELVPPPLPRPAGALSIIDFGAIADDEGDDTAALKACVAAARQQQSPVWIPPGVYRQAGKITLAGVTIRGAGMWYTTLAGTASGSDFGGTVGFHLSGSGATISDLSVTSLVHTSRATKGGKPFTSEVGQCRAWLVENVWITHTNVGFWIGGAVDGAIRGCRVRSTYADAINLNRGSSRNLVEDCHVRGCGDDGIALLSELGPRDPNPSMANTVRHNTVSALWWGHNCDLAGGGGHLIEDNLLADNALFGCFTINLPAAYPMHPQSASTVRRNRILRGGGNAHGQKRGAVWIYAGSTTIDDVSFSDNQIDDAIFRGIHLAGSGMQHMTFERNRIDRPGEDGIVILPEVRGSGRFAGNLVSGLGEGRLPLRRPSGDGYAVQEAPTPAAP